jgi:peptidoglycan/LPS O-acetylase OafA/YrhL
MALLLVAVTTGRPRRLVRLLDARPVRGLGRFSYSLYLIHLPIVVVISRVLARYDVVPPGLPTFGATLLLAVPAALVLARLFAAVFELPFQRHRGWPIPHRPRSLDTVPDHAPAGCPAPAQSRQPA